MDDTLKQNYPTHESALERIRELMEEVDDLKETISGQDEIIARWWTEE